MKLVSLESIKKTITDTVKDSQHVYPDDDWTFEAPFGESWQMRVFEKNYLPPLAAVLGKINPKRYLVIGPLLGTTESYALKKTAFNPDFMVLCDIDHGSCNWLRNNLAYAYTNITGQRGGDYQNNLVIVRGDSMKVSDKLVALGPFDLIFVDGNHSREYTLADLDTAKRALAPDGVIMLHDIDAKSNPTGEWFEEFKKANEGYSFIEIRGDVFQNGIAIFKKELI